MSERETIYPITSELLQNAFDKAEGITAEQYKSQTCSMEDKDGKNVCPICFFRIKVREILGIPKPNYFEVNLNDEQC